MMFFTIFSIKTLFFGLIIGWHIAFNYPDLANLQGEWVATLFFRHGQETPEDRLKGLRLIVKGNNYIQGNLNKRRDYQEFRIDESKTPKEIDFFKVELNVRQVKRGIYELDGNRLILCFGKDPLLRPAGFRLGEYHYKWVFKRKE